MIFYFSATGNSRYVAERIAVRCGDRTESIAEHLRGGQLQAELEKGEQLGFVTPVYFYGIPSPVRRFVQEMELHVPGRLYTWHVVTFGTATGSANRMLADELKKRRIDVNAFFSVRMPDTWTPMYDVSDAGEVSRILKASEKEIDRCAEHIAAGDGGDFNRHKGISAITPAAYGIYRHVLSTRSFHVKDSCISCGFCAEQCPDEAIRMTDGKPEWLKERCAFCLGCLHRCPAGAVRFGRNTEKHGQYQHPGQRSV